MSAMTGSGDNSMSGKVWGLVAEFPSAEGILAAAKRTREAGFTKFDVYSPIPLHGLDEAMGISMTKLPWFVLGGGVTGASVALLLQWWTNAINYPFIISAKPFFSLPANIPIIFELTVLFAAISAFVGMLVSNGLPQFYHPLFRLERFQRVTNDRFFLGIEASDPKFEFDGTRAFLESLGGSAVESVGE